MVDILCPIYFIPQTTITQYTRFIIFLNRNLKLLRSSIFGKNKGKIITRTFLSSGNRFGTRDTARPRESRTVTMFSDNSPFSVEPAKLKCDYAFVCNYIHLSDHERQIWFCLWLVALNALK